MTASKVIFETLVILLFELVQVVVAEKAQQSEERVGGRRNW